MQVQPNQPKTTKEKQMPTSYKELTRTEAALANTSALLSAFMSEVGIDPEASTVTITMPNGDKAVINAGDALSEAQNILEEAYGDE